MNHMVKWEKDVSSSKEIMMLRLRKVWIIAINMA
jgi:hypothetical protein